MIDLTVTIDVTIYSSNDNVRDIALFHPLPKTRSICFSSKLFPNNFVCFNRLIPFRCRTRFHFSLVFEIVIYAISFVSSI